MRAHQFSNNSNNKYCQKPNVNIAVEKHNRWSDVFCVNSTVPFRQQKNQ